MSDPYQTQPSPAYAALRRNEPSVEVSQRGSIAVLIEQAAAVFQMSSQANEMIRASLDRLMGPIPEKVEDARKEPPPGSEVAQLAAFIEGTQRELRRLHETIRRLGAL